jgi:hypothetical protein
MSQRFFPRVQSARDPPSRVKSRINHRPGGVELTPNGIRFSRATPVFRVTRGGGKRGTVRGFSPAAARRLRELLFCCDFHPKGKGVIGLCLTLPSEAAPGLGDAVWNQIRTHRKQFPGVLALIWRKERQRNGREHYHCILWTAADNPLPTAGALVKAWCRLVAKRCGEAVRIEKQMLWAHCRSNVRYFDTDLSNFPPSAPEREAEFAKLVSYLPCLTRIGCRGQGVQYLVEHVGRFKHLQAKTGGRAWGIWNRERLPKHPPGSSRHVLLSLSEDVELARILRRKSRYPIPAPCPFGWKLHRGRRFLQGTQIVASGEIRDAVQRWLEWRRMGARALG